DKKTDKENKLTITNSGGLSQEEIERMIKEAEMNKEKDEEFKANTATLNQAQTYCATFEKQIEQFQNLYNDLKKATDEKDYPKLKKLISEIEELMKLSNELMQKMPKEGEKEEDVLDVQPEKNNGDD